MLSSSKQSWACPLPPQHGLCSQRTPTAQRSSLRFHRDCSWRGLPFPAHTQEVPGAWQLPKASPEAKDSPTSGRAGTHPGQRILQSGTAAPAPPSTELRRGCRSRLCRAPAAAALHQQVIRVGSAAGEWHSLAGGTGGLCWGTGVPRFCSHPRAGSCQRLQHCLRVSPAHGWTRGSHLSLHSTQRGQEVA